MISSKTLALFYVTDRLNQKQKEMQVLLKIMLDLEDETFTKGATEETKYN